MSDKKLKIEFNSLGSRFLSSIRVFGSLVKEHPEIQAILDKNTKIPYSPEAINRITGATEYIDTGKILKVGESDIIFNINIENVDFGIEDNQFLTLKDKENQETFLIIDIKKIKKASCE